jgi:putative flippase GtrA
MLMAAGAKAVGFVWSFALNRLWTFLNRKRLSWQGQKIALDANYASTTAPILLLL